MLADAGIVLTAAERESIEVADFGLGRLEETGLQIVVYVNTERVCAKELVLFPRQTCPEHRHPPVGADPGKEETFRCRHGPRAAAGRGRATRSSCARASSGRSRRTRCTRSRQAPKGAVVSEFSTRSRDETDVFTDPRIVR